MSETQWLVVDGALRDNPESVKRYLYGGNYLLESKGGSTLSGPRWTHLVLVTDRRGDAERAAETQADRLRSGLMRVWVCATLSEAGQVIAELE